jgi:hypothetical protein
VATFDYTTFINPHGISLAIGFMGIVYHMTYVWHIGIDYQNNHKINVDKYIVWLMDKSIYVDP